MLRRSDFIAATYALSFVFANFGIAIAARMPMMTTTISSSISVKPFLLVIVCLLSVGGYQALARHSLPERLPRQLRGNPETRRLWPIFWTALRREGTSTCRLGNTRR